MTGSERVRCGARDLHMRSTATALSLNVLLSSLSRLIASCSTRRQLLPFVNKDTLVLQRTQVIRHG